MKITGFLNKLQKSKKSLEQMTDEITKKVGFDHNEHYYGDLGVVEETDDLNTMREIFLDYLEKDMSEKFIRKLHLLLEVERELTLREGE